MRSMSVQFATFGIVGKFSSDSLTIRTSMIESHSAALQDMGSGNALLMVGGGRHPGRQQRSGLMTQLIHPQAPTAPFSSADSSGRKLADRHATRNTISALSQPSTDGSHLDPCATSFVSTRKYYLRQVYPVC